MNFIFLCSFQSFNRFGYQKSQLNSSNKTIDFCFQLWFKMPKNPLVDSRVAQTCCNVTIFELRRIWTRWKTFRMKYLGWKRDHICMSIGLWQIAWQCVFHTMYNRWESFITRSQVTTFWKLGSKQTEEICIIATRILRKKTTVQLWPQWPCPTASLSNELLVCYSNLLACTTDTLRLLKWWPGYENWPRQWAFSGHKHKNKEQKNKENLKGED